MPLGYRGDFHDTVIVSVLRALAERSRGGLGAESNIGSVTACNVYTAMSLFAIVTWFVKQRLFLINEERSCVTCCKTV